jgi:hypothetical protein
MNRQGLCSQVRYQVAEAKEGGLAMQQTQTYIDLLIDALLDEGFTVKEAQHLIKLQEEYQERKANEETNYHRFMRWLVEHGRLSDW